MEYSVDLVVDDSMNRLNKLSIQSNYHGIRVDLTKHILLNTNSAARFEVESKDK